MKKIPYLLVVIIWMSLSIMEIVSYIFFSHSLVYWRAWEKVSNYEGKDHSEVPFKPLTIYDGKSEGDLLNPLNLTPLPDEKRHQYFEVDEYGFRNKKGFLKKPVDAVITGSSFVAGAQIDQKNLVSEILTHKYKIRTYNYAIIPVNHFWEDARFYKNKPKYLILLGAEGEFYSSAWRFEIPENTSIKQIPAWSSYDAWKKSNQISTFKFSELENELKIFSLTRYFTNNIYIHILNTLYTREQISRLFPSQYVTYDKESKMLYWGIDYDNPIYGQTDKTQENLQNSIKKYINTRDKLKSRGITLIIAAMPSKTHLGLSKYRYLPNDKRAILKLENELEKNNIEHVDLFGPMYSYVEKTGKPLYYPDDSHWNNSANQIITNLLAEKIYSLENK